MGGGLEAGSRCAGSRASGVREQGTDALPRTAGSAGRLATRSRVATSAMGSWRFAPSRGLSARVRARCRRNSRPPSLGCVKRCSASPRLLLPHSLEHENVSSFESGRIRRDSTMKWSDVLVFAGEPLPDECVGVEPTDEGRWSGHLGPMRLGVLHEPSRSGLPIAESGDRTTVTRVPDQECCQGPDCIVPLSLAEFGTPPGASRTNPTVPQ